MANREWLNGKSASLVVETRTWGSSGRSAREAIEEQLDVQLGDEIGEFVETIGNASIGPFMIVVAGDEQGQMSAVTETNVARSVRAELPREYIKVMDHAGESCFYDARSEGVFAFDSLNIDPAMKTLSFDGFDKFFEWAFEEAKLQSEDNEFAF
jgi:hypothetical protein